MSSRAATARSARPPGTDWQDSYFSLEERYRRLQRQFNEQQQELRVAKVARRREEAPPAGPSLSSVPGRRSSARPGHHTDGGGTAASSAAAVVFSVPPGITTPPRRWAAYRVSRDNSVEEHAEAPQDYVAVDSAAAPQVATAAAITEASAWGGAAATLPDPAMVWGTTDGHSSLQNYVVASALYHANEELRRKLNESVTTLQTLQQELASSRAQHATAQTRLENVSAQLHHLVRERDLATQKFTNAHHTIADLERTLRDRVAEEERVRFSLESQITELRSRLVVGADSNDLLQKDVRSLLSETRDRTAEAMKLRSNLALAESALSSQRHVNENMLVELKSLNTQLVEERKRLLTVTREAQLAALSGTRVADLEGQLRRVQEERSAIEREHVGLMSEFVRVTEDALLHAREEVRCDVADWRAAAAHWEKVSQLLYKDIAERTQQHLQCRAECEAAQGQRDVSGLEVRALKGEVALLTAKLDVVWPSHATDAKDLTAEEILHIFGRKDRAGLFLFDDRRRRRAAARRRHRRSSGAVGGSSATATATATTTTFAAAGEGGKEEGGGGSGSSDGGGEEEEEDEGFDLAASVLVDLPADPTTVACQLQELHEANAALVSDVHQLRLTNDLLRDRLDGLAGRQGEERARVAAAEVSLRQRETAGHRLLERQLDRVAFLEAQVKSLRGYHVPMNAPIGEVAESENIFELFLGQLVGAEAADGLEVPDMFSTMFCSADFLVHETITTGTVRGFNGFFDVTASFCVSMDALLLYYLHTRQLLVQLHRVRDVDEAAVTTTATTAAEAAASSEVQHREGLHGSSAGAAGEARGASSGGRDGSSGSSTHPSLRLAENMFETVAEGQVSLAEVVQREDCLHAARPTLKGHVRLLTPSGRHVASVEYRLTARRPYTADFVRLVEECATAAPPSAAAAEGAEATSGDLRGGSSSHLLEWMRTTADTSGEATAEQQGSGRRTRTAAPRQMRSDQTVASERAPFRPARRQHLQLVPVTASDGDAASTASSFFAEQHRPSRMTGTSGALVVHLPAPSPPPVAPSLTRLAYSAGGSPPSSRADGDSFAAGHSPVSASFVHVDRSLLCPEPAVGGRGGAAPGLHIIRRLRVEVERLELPADLPLPIPRLSCYFRVDAVHREVWLDAPPTPRYTWVYASDPRDGGAALEVSSVTQLSSIVREPLVLFLLDADAMASSGAAAVAAAAEPCVWAMVVCEWTQAVQLPDQPHSFALPLLRLDQSVVRGAVLRLSLTASTTTGVDAVQPVAPVSPPPIRAAQESATGPRLLPPPPLPAAPPPADRTMEEELLRLEYSQRTGRSFV
ncbi:hypothetical protein NESM_000536400 [Novymonas esmeraldas]|uniref:RPGR-interacting protein 1 first C2 domain-containing protein n=1 Tax=Novymonas esmeraldas TaxID=1808958 RepID=A0AAW0EQN0_9TRYP